MDRRMRDLLYFNNDVPRSLPRKFQDILKMPTFEYVQSRVSVSGVICKRTNSCQLIVAASRNLWGSTISVVLNVLLGTQDGLNLRNLLWHGFATKVFRPKSITCRMLSACLLFSLPTCRPNSTVPISHSCAWPSSVCPRHRRHFGTRLRQTWVDCADVNAKSSPIIRHSIDRKEMMGEPRPLTDFHRFVHNLDFGLGTRAFPGTNQPANQHLLAHWVERDLLTLCDGGMQMC